MNVKPQIDEAESNALTPLPFLTEGMEPLQELAERSARLSDLMDRLSGLAGDAAARPLARLQRELEESEPAITFLGQVKSGKTTLVNAVAGWSDLLPSDVNPWTSVVTSLHLIPGETRSEIGACFQMMKADEWDRLVQKGGRLGELADRAGAGDEMEKIRQQVEELREKSRRRLGKKFEMLLGQEHDYGYFDKELLERYICLGDDVFEDEDTDAGAETQGRFADITKSADLTLHSPTCPVRLCLRDTPGVNDTFMMREQVTINAVRNSRICVVVLSAHQALSSVDMGLIRLISSMSSRDVIIFVNRIDELGDPENQIPEIEASIRKVLAENNGPEGADILFGSAWWANMVLSDSVDEQTEATAARLSGMSDRAKNPGQNGYSAAENLWHLSGMPALQRAIGNQVVSSIGNALLRRTAASMATIATGQQAANKVMISGDETETGLTMQEIRRELEALTQRHLDALNSDLADVTKNYRARADRAHITFVDRATHSLITHLEKIGAEHMWEYNPAGLRMLLKSAFSVFASRAQSVSRKNFEAATEELAGFYFRAFGKAVEGVQLSVPDVPEMPAPVSLAQSIALDFNDGWWKSWWRRTRGYQAFAKRFRSLISAETEEFMARVRDTQPDEINAELIGAMTAFIEQNRDVLYEIGNSRGDKDGLQRLCLGAGEADRVEQLEDILKELKAYAAMPDMEPADHG